MTLRSPIFLGLLTVFSLTTTAAKAQSNIPLVFRDAQGQCAVSAEICGDGIDQDCNGSDLACASPDKDFDGFADSVDCDDSNRNVYTGVTIACQASCGSGTKTCGSNGQFTACSCTPLCEAGPGARCYYISKLTGNDSNPGTFAAPWRTYLPIAANVPAGMKPSTSRTLQPGDAVYFMSGTYTDSYSYSGMNYGLRLDNIGSLSAGQTKIKAYPGAKAVISGATPTSSGGLYMINSRNVLIEGLEFTKSFGDAINLAENTNVEIRNVHVHDIDGTDNYNISGVKINTNNGVNLHHSLLHDNYDRTNADTGGNKTENSRNIVIFDGGNIHIHHNIIFQTPPFSDPKAGGGCITYKHGNVLPGAIFEANHNILWNCWDVSIGTNAPRSRIHHNIIHGGGAIAIQDFGGTTIHQDEIIEKNTLIKTNISYKPVTDYGYPIGNVTIRNNIIVEQNSGYTNENGILRIHPNGNDLLYNAVVTTRTLFTSGNCYYNPNSTPMFNLFAYNNQAGANLGGLHSFSAWKAMGFDTNSVIADPQLDQSMRPANPACQGAGAHAP